MPQGLLLLIFLKREEVEKSEVIQGFKDGAYLVQDEGDNLMSRNYSGVRGHAILEEALPCMKSFSLSGKDTLGNFSMLSQEVLQIYGFRREHTDAQLASVKTLKVWRLCSILWRLL